MRPYTPDRLPLENLDYQRLFALIGDANAELARYDGLLQGIVNPSVMLSPLTNEEAVLSSKKEGTQATVDEVLEQEADILKKGEKAKDIQEIINYREALRSAHHYLDDRRISLSFVHELHRILLSGVRGQDKTPGEFRKDQNWIGKYGCTREQASFAIGLLRQLKSADILKELRPGIGRRAAVLCFSELLNIAEGKKIL